MELSVLNNYKTQLSLKRNYFSEEAIKGLACIRGAQSNTNYAESFEVTDANGLNRFKSGFVVDGFSGHKIGDAKHTDYKCSIDMTENELRPKCTPKGVKLQEAANTDSLRESANYKRTGDLITLPYEEIMYQEQPYASRVERVTPLLMSTWIGHIDLDPEGDEWFETETAPDFKEYEIYNFLPGFHSSTSSHTQFQFLSGLPAK